MARLAFVCAVSAITAGAKSLLGEHAESRALAEAHAQANMTLSLTGKEALKARSRSMTRAVTLPPVLTIADVTTPTAYPPPPPALDPWNNYQPMDTFLGGSIVQEFIPKPTATPPPTQMALDTLNSCPLLPSGVAVFPDRFYVRAPACSGGEPRKGIWYMEKSDENVELVTWWESPIATEKAELSFNYGSDRKARTMTLRGFGQKVSVDVLDCRERKLFVIEEQVSRLTQGYNEAACVNYGSCSGEVYVKYQIFKYLIGGGRTLAAETPWLTLFQDEFQVLDAGGVKVAEFVRKGRWSPMVQCPEYSKDWMVSFDPPTASMPELALPNNRWVIGVLNTVMAIRDDSRASDGLVKFSYLQLRNIGIVVAVIVSFFLVVFGVFGCIRKYFKRPCTLACIKLEKMWFPYAQYRPTKFDP